MKETGLIERIKNGESVMDLRSDIIKAMGKAGLALLLKGIPFANDLQQFVNAFIENL